MATARTSPVPRLLRNRSAAAAAAVAAARCRNRSCCRCCRRPPRRLAWSCWLPRSAPPAPWTTKDPRRAWPQAARLAGEGLKKKKKWDEFARPRRGRPFRPSHHARRRSLLLSGAPTPAAVPFLVGSSRSSVCFRARLTPAGKGEALPPRASWLTPGLLRLPSSPGSLPEPPKGAQELKLRRLWSLAPAWLPSLLFRLPASSAQTFPPQKNTRVPLLPRGPERRTSS